MVALQGLFAVAKPRGMGSAEAVARIKRALAGAGGTRKLKVGHGGTLDREAEGVLVIGVGRCTRLLSTYLKCTKRYKVDATLGETTPSLDRDPMLAAQLTRAPWQHVTRDDLHGALQQFCGEGVMQLPPRYSALKIGGGRRASQAARTGQALLMQPRRVAIASAVLAAFEPPRFSLEVTCGGGAYVRSLVRDVAFAAATVGVVDRLVRVQQGPFLLVDALPATLWDGEHLLEAMARGDPGAAR